MIEAQKEKVGVSGTLELKFGLIFWLYRHDWHFWMTGSQNYNMTRGKDRSVPLMRLNC